MTIEAIRKKLAAYIEVADEKKIRAIYTMVEDDIHTAGNEWPKDFIDELEQRSKSFDDGSAKTYSWEETKKAARERIKQAGK